MVYLNSTVFARSTGERGCGCPAVCNIMCENVEQLLRERCPHISEHFLPDLLAKFQKHDIDASMLLAGELNDADLQAIGALCMLGPCCSIVMISTAYADTIHCLSCLLWPAGVEQLGIRKKLLKAFCASNSAAAAPGEATPTDTRDHVTAIWTGPVSDHTLLTP
jgi:hypothetical protein